MPKSQDIDKVGLLKEKLILQPCQCRINRGCQKNPQEIDCKQSNHANAFYQDRAVKLCVKWNVCQKSNLSLSAFRPYPLSLIPLHSFVLRQSFFREFRFLREKLKNPGKKIFDARKLSWL